MPVRIYDISKKLGLENKEVLAKAKELGIAAARVASSSLDKITAEYLEEQLKQAHPELNAPAPTSTPPPPVASPAAPSASQPEVIIATAPEPPVGKIQEITSMTATATFVLEPEVPAVEEPAPDSTIETGSAPAVVSEPPPEV